MSVTGGIAFIGLMTSHIARTLVGPRHGLIIPIAILVGGWLLMLANTIGLHLIEPNDIPAGIVTALIGALYFLYFLLCQIKRDKILWSNFLPTLSMKWTELDKNTRASLGFLIFRLSFSNFNHIAVNSKYEN